MPCCALQLDLLTGSAVSYALTPTGRVQRPDILLLCQWILDAWKAIPANLSPLRDIWWSCWVPSMFRAPPSSRDASPQRFAPEDEPAAQQASRRLQGDEPEFGTVQDQPRQRKDAATSTATSPKMSTPIILQQPQVPPTFNGSSGEDPEEWLDQYERVASFNNWDDASKFQHVFFALESSARTWYENRESSLTTWELFKKELMKVFTSVVRKERAVRLLESRIQLPNEPVRGYVEEIKRLFRRADTGMTEKKKVTVKGHTYPASFV
ncbi:uncharacterized protein LOC144114589 [Amblyomma americanum]